MNCILPFEQTDRLEAGGGGLMLVIPPVEGMGE